MGNDRSVLRKIRIGQLHGGAFTDGELASVEGNLRIYHLPLLFHSLDEVEHVRQHMDGVLHERLEEKGLEVLGVSDAGFACVTSVKPLRGLADMGDHRVSTPAEDPVATKTFELAGLTAVPLPIADVDTALQTGLLDAVATTTTGAIVFQWHTRVKHMIDWPLEHVNGYLVVDAKTFARAAEADRRIVRDVMQRVVRRDQCLQPQRQ